MFPVTVPAELLASDNNTVSAIVMQWTQMRLGCQLVRRYTRINVLYMCSSLLNGLILVLTSFHAGMLVGSAVRLFQGLPVVSQDSPVILI